MGADLLNVRRHDVLFPHLVRDAQRWGHGHSGVRDLRISSEGGNVEMVGHTHVHRDVGSAWRLHVTPHARDARDGELEAADEVDEAEGGQDPRDVVVLRAVRSQLRLRFPHCSVCRGSRLRAAVRVLRVRGWEVQPDRVVACEHLPQLCEALVLRQQRRRDPLAVFHRGVCHLLSAQRGLVRLASAWRRLHCDDVVGRALRPILRQPLPSAGTGQKHFRHLCRCWQCRDAVWLQADDARGRADRGRVRERSYLSTRRDALRRGLHGHQLEYQPEGA
mmetsp:Transcript_89325/g.251461  ORF Transcript_89325/g.251461 Transcript_89325/m.251461 type:complete len:276 (+) Transcript_89325:796-1623(+)